MLDERLRVDLEALQGGPVLPVDPPVESEDGIARWQPFVRSLTRASPLHVPAEPDLPAYNMSLLVRTLLADADASDCINRLQSYQPFSPSVLPDELVARIIALARPTGLQAPTRVREVCRRFAALTPARFYDSVRLVGHARRGDHDPDLRHVCGTIDLLRRIDKLLLDTHALSGIRELELCRSGASDALWIDSQIGEMDMVVDYHVRRLDRSIASLLGQCPNLVRLTLRNICIGRSTQAWLHGAARLDALRMSVVIVYLNGYPSFDDGRATIRTLKLDRVDSWLATALIRVASPHELDVADKYASSLRGGMFLPLLAVTPPVPLAPTIRHFAAKHMDSQTIGNLLSRASRASQPLRLQSLLLAHLEPRRRQFTLSSFLSNWLRTLERLGHTLTFFVWAEAPRTEAELSTLLRAMPHLVVLGLSMGSSWGLVQWPLHAVRYSYRAALIKSVQRQIAGVLSHLPVLRLFIHDIDLAIYQHYLASAVQPRIEGAYGAGLDDMLPVVEHPKADEWTWDVVWDLDDDEEEDAIFRDRLFGRLPLLEVAVKHQHMIDPRWSRISWGSALLRDGNGTEGIARPQWRWASESHASAAVRSHFPPLLRD